MISLPDLAYRLRARRALLIGAGQAAVYEWRDNAAVRRTVFEAGEEGRQGFRRYLAETPGIPFYLLVDVADEEYRQDTVPHLSRRDRQALLERKAARLFKDTGYCFFRVTGRETTGRRDDRVLLSALANPGVVRQWVAILDEARTPLAGICSLPLFSGQLLKVVAGRDDGCRLLVSMQGVSGLRQTCFDNGDLRFSRLVQTPRAEHESYVGDYPVMKWKRSCVTWTAGDRTLPARDVACPFPVFRRPVTGTEIRAQDSRIQSGTIFVTWRMKTSQANLSPTRSVTHISCSNC